MTTTEIKEEIHKAVEQVPENTLEAILNFVKTRQVSSDEKLDQIFEKILIEDREVLQRLAK
jgi:hypothetical protein